MLVAEINRGNFEYDVHAILQAFYPEEQVRVLTPETGEEKRTVLRQEKECILIRLHPEGAVIALKGQEYCWSWPEDEAGGDCLEGERWEGEGGSAPISAEKEVLEPEEGEEKRYKYGFKCFLYRTLSQVTGRTLPWGNLTGIRPTKIAYEIGRAHV